MKLIVGLEIRDPSMPIHDTTLVSWWSRSWPRHGIKVRGNLGPPYGQREIAGQSVILLQPTTFMNDSGRAVAYACRRSQVDLDDILIIYDDLDLPLGRIRLRAKGSSGGHKGLRSIITALGTQDIGRLRIGIGRPQGQDVVDYVLSPFSAEEMPTLEQAVAKLATL